MRVLIKNVREKYIIFILAIAAGFSTSLYAEEKIFYFCSADVKEQNKYYVTKLFEGRIQIVTTENLRLHLVEKLKLDSVTVKCFSYGSDVKPVKYQQAEKLRSLEIRQKQIRSDVELLQWSPD